MTAPAPMTAPTRVGNRAAAGRSRIVSRVAGPVPPAAPARPRPAPPAPVPPLPPPARPLAVGSGQVSRVVAAVVMTLVVVGGLSWIGQGSIQPGADPGIPADTAVVYVGAGETVWDVARRVAPQSDQRAVVERIRQLNGLVDSAVAPGQQLQVPDGR